MSDEAKAFATLNLRTQEEYVVEDTTMKDNIRLRELLVEVRQLLDDIYAEDIVSSDDLGKVYEKIERELGDDND